MEQHCPCTTLLDAHAWFSEEITSLDGKWRFLATDGPEPEGWLTEKYDDRKWSRAVLPEVSSDHPAGGLYRKGFQLSGSRGSRRVILRIRRLPRELNLWINGQFQGTAPGILGDAEFDITDSLKTEGNRVCIRCSGPFTGSVGLYVLPQRAIRDVRLCRRVMGQGNAALSAEVRCSGAEGFTVRMALMDGQNIISHGESVIRDGVGQALLSLEGVRSWNPESPSLYRLALILWDGIAIHQTRELTVGIRDAKIEENRLTVNGNPEQIRAMRYQPGRADAAVFTELQTIRVHNCNAVLLSGRASEEVLAACDRIGLYVLEQTGFSREDCTEALCASRACHPCLIGWDLGAADHIPLALEPGMAVQAQVPVCVTDNLREAWRKLAPVVCHYADGVMTVENRSTFLSTQEYDSRLVLCRDGEEAATWPIPGNAMPGESVSFPVETRYDIYKPGRYHLSAEFRRKSDGVLLAKDQWEVGNLRHIYDENPGGTIREEAGRLLLRSQDSGYTIDRATGCPGQISCFGLDLLTEGLTPVFCAPGSGLRIPDEWERFTARWKQPRPAILEVDQMTRRVSASFRLGSGLMQTYRLFADGSLAVELRLRTGKTAPDRMGWKCRPDPRLTRCRWFGLGPEGTGEGRYYGIHTELPKDSELRAPVYELTLAEESGAGMTIRAEEGFRFAFREGTLYLLLPEEAEWKPHTTYTFHLTVSPAKWN